MNSGQKRQIIDILILSGSEWKDPVKIVSVYTPVWLAYDKYYQWGSTSLSSGAEMIPSPSADAMESEQDKEALKYYEVKNQRREELAEEARADSGEIKFEVTSSLRQTWVAE